MIALDRVLAYVYKSELKPKATDATGIKADPPKIFHSTKPAVLVIFDGQPIWSPIKDNDLRYAVNTKTSLPDDFKKIPVDHPRSRVLASVPGTDQATEAGAANRPVASAAVADSGVAGSGVADSDGGRIARSHVSRFLCLRNRKKFSPDDGILRQMTHTTVRPEINSSSEGEN